MFHVKYEGEYFQIREIQAGVLQGSILSPLFHILYDSDTPEVAGTTTATFADDTAILSIDKTKNEAEHKYISQRLLQKK